MEMTTPLSSAQHPDFIWTWKRNNRNAKASLWLPYFSEATKIARSKKWRLDYKGGALEVDLKQVDFVMLYGGNGNLTVEFLEALSQHKIPLMIHRRNMPHPYVFFPTAGSDDEDVLSRQIQVRSHLQKRVYVSKTLIKKRLQHFSPVFDVPVVYLDRLGKAKSIEEIRSVEAVQTAKFWKKWFAGLGVEEARRKDGKIGAALDAASVFMFGVILRWVLFHKLSPCHGFMHEPTSYPSLVYDLMEPYRYILERAVAQAFKSFELPIEEIEEKKLIARTFVEIKDLLDEVVYVPQTRQYVRRKNLLHGIVLSLRAYLLNEEVRFVIPTEGEKKGGRPPKVGFTLPGEIWQK